LLGCNRFVTRLGTSDVDDDDDKGPFECRKCEIETGVQKGLVTLTVLTVKPSSGSTFSGSSSCASDRSIELGLVQTDRMMGAGKGTRSRLFGREIVN
jgi:hypothetical protein